jgi:hypothetical protein
MHAIISLATSSNSTSFLQGLPAPSVTDVILTFVAVVAVIVAILSRQDTKRQADASMKSTELQKSALELQKRQSEEEARRFLSTGRALTTMTS